jgi:hypothetical protein
MTTFLNNRRQLSPGKVLKKFSLDASLFPNAGLDDVSHYFF